MIDLIQAGARPERSVSDRRERASLLACSLALMAVLCFSGCASTPFIGQALVPSYEPSNVFMEEPLLPASLRRIAVLPMSSLTEDAETEFGRDALAPVLMSELSRVRKFELVAVSADELRLLSGRAVWNPEDKLPLEFFEKLKEKYGVDAVMFSRLTLYRAYEPLAIGWRLKLVDADEPRILWAVDEVFDSRVPSVAAGAVRYAKENTDGGSSLSDPRSVMISARRFGEYTVNAVVHTIPGRAVAAR